MEFLENSDPRVFSGGALNKAVIETKWESVGASCFRRSFYPEKIPWKEAQCFVPFLSCRPLKFSLLFPTRFPISPFVTSSAVLRDSKKQKDPSEVNGDNHSWPFSKSDGATIIFNNVTGVKLETKGVADSNKLS